jgi:hypothetical protein
VNPEVIIHGKEIDVKLVQMKQVKVALIGAVADNPHLSNPKIKHYSVISETSARRNLERHYFHPYHVTLHQQLHGKDSKSCTISSMNTATTEDRPEIFQNILPIDEATFINHGQVKTRTVHFRCCSYSRVEAGSNTSTVAL